MTPSTPVSATIGSSLIGLAAVLLWGLNGRIAGVSGVAAGLLGPRPADSGWRWRALFLLGLALGTALFGLGWGLAGCCPRPAIALLGFGNAEALWFLPAMAAGAALQRWRAPHAATAGTH